MTERPLLLPIPRRISQVYDALPLVDGKLIVIRGPQPQDLYFSARRLQAALRNYAGLSWEIVAGNAIPAEQIGLTLSVVPSATPNREGYELTITPEGITIVASEPAGVFYGGATLIQVLAQYQQQLPGLHVADWPDFPNRGVMLDISRDKVPTMETLYDLIDMLASWKVNQFQLYTEHTFAYRNHPEVWAAASPVTGEEILALDAYCRERFVELVPNQNSFGHMKRWLSHSRYRHLAEMEEGWFETPWKGFKLQAPFSLCPIDDRSIEFVRGLYDELLPHFSSQQFNVGCDETFDVGQGRSKAAVEEMGAGRVYLAFLQQIHREVQAHGRTMQFWGDIIVNHPELVPELLRALSPAPIALEWGYEANHPFAQNGAVFAQSGAPFYVCPGTSSWNAIAGRTANAMGNLLNAAENGLQHGAVGFLNTDWGDNGHWQPLPVSYLGFAYGAAVSWACEANREIPIAEALSRFAFTDASGTMGRLAFDLGNVHQETGVLTFNSTILFRLLQYRPHELDSMKRLIAHSEGLEPERFWQTRERIDELIGKLPEAQMQRPDADLISREYRWAARLLQHSCRRAAWMLGSEDGRLRESLHAEIGELLDEYEAIWMARNRPGGFKDSLALLAPVKSDYLGA